MIIFPYTYSLYCYSSYGPTFGNIDIKICDNSNLSSESYAHINSSCIQSPSDLNDPKKFYFCDEKNFQVKEIEIYEIENLN